MQSISFLNFLSVKFVYKFAFNSKNNIEFVYLKTIYPNADRYPLVTILQ